MTKLCDLSTDGLNHAHNDADPSGVTMREYLDDNIPEPLDNEEIDEIFI